MSGGEKAGTEFNLTQGSFKPSLAKNVPFFQKFY